VTNCALSYRNVQEVFRLCIEKPDWYDRKYPDVTFCPYEYLIRGHPSGRASTPKFTSKVVDRILRQCSNLMLEKKDQTASWGRILNRNAGSGVYAVFFKVYPGKQENMYDEERPNNGEYLQMAIVDNEHRSVLPGNPVGTGMIIGQDLEDLCDQKDKSTFITKILNRPTSGKARGLYPSKEYPHRKKIVIMQGVYELKQVPITHMYNKLTSISRTEGAHNRKNSQSISNGDRKPAPQHD